jgi:UDPglucose--hexose-1-phosphate uridylyltransferase
MQPISELRRDIVSGEWVVIALARGKRPRIKKKFSSLNRSLAACRFKELSNTLLLYALNGRHKKKPALGRAVAHPGDKAVWGMDWWVRVVPNVFPAFGSGRCSTMHRSGPYQWLDGVGSHEIVVTKDHERSFAKMNDDEVELVIRAYQDRYLALKKDRCVRYVSIFHNHGPGSGASVYHPHSQIITTPIIPLDVYRSLNGAGRYFRKHKTCVHCVLLRYEQRVKERIVFENKKFIVLAPYASKSAFQLRIYPKDHSAHFEDIAPEERMALANALRMILAKFAKGLENTGYNFFVHTAPKNHGTEFEYYHWHIELLAKTEIVGGFEIGTGIEIAVVSPEDASKILRKVKV